MLAICEGGNKLTDLQKQDEAAGYLTAPKPPQGKYYEKMNSDAARETPS